MHNSITICFYGSSDQDLPNKLADLYYADIENIVNEILILSFQEIKVITGGYGGIMNTISEKFYTKRSYTKDKTIEIIGITCDAYDFEYPENENYNPSNDYSKFNDVIIQSENFSSRIQAMIELSDLFILMPGKQGSLSEFLLTYDTYHNNQHFVNQKHTKIFIHEYWQDLLKNENYFRPFSSIISFFNSKNFASFINDIYSIKKKYYQIELPGNEENEENKFVNYTVNDFIFIKFKGLEAKIKKIIYGRLFDEVKVMSRLKKSENNILSIDFGWFLSDNTDYKKDGQYLSISSEIYSKYLDDFFNSYNSIMLGQFTNDFQWSYLKGTFIHNVHTILKKEINVIPQWDKNKAKSSFKEWRDFLNEKKYGQTLIWRGFRITGQGVTNEIILSVFLLLNYKIPKGKIESIRQVIEDFLLSVSSKKTAQLFEEKDRDTINQATKAAISQVLARNMSHNIGSHVSYRSTNIKVKQRAEELSKGITKHEVFSQWLDYFSEKLDKYEIYRNEYLSDFDQSPRFARFYQDVILPFCENLLIMDNLAAGEHLNYKDVAHNNLRVKCKIDGIEIKAVYPDLVCMVSETENIEPISYPDNFPYLLKHKRFESDPDKNTLQSAMNNRQIIGTKDVEFCLHSEQALYSILENFIRNSAKHKPQGSGEELVIVLDLHTAINDRVHHTLYLYDESSCISKQDIFDKDDESALYQRIKQSLLEDSGKPRRANWGFADMKINSFLLFNRVDAINSNALANNFDLVVLSEHGDENPVFETVDESMVETLENKKYRFGYKMKISPARKILWVGDFLSGSHVGDFAQAGLVWVETIEDAINLQLNNGLLAFQFAVINVSLTYKEFLNYEEKLPGRVLLLHVVSQTPDRSSRIVKAEDKELAGVADMEQLLRWCWQQWLVARNGKVNLFMYFMNADINDHWTGIGEDSLSLINEIKLTLIDKDKTYLLTNDEINIIYDHHGNSFTKKSKGDMVTDIIKINNDVINFATRHSLIYFDKGSEDFPTLNYPPVKPNDREFLLYQIIDAATTNVFIVDERISEYALNEKIGDFQWKGARIRSNLLRNSAWSMYVAGKVFIIHALQNDNFISHVGKQLEETDRLTLEITNNSFRIKTLVAGLEQIENVRKDVLIIHRTYLDKEKIGMDPNNFLSEAKRKFGAVFVTSGGGYPHNLSTRYKFIPFSVLESCLNYRLSKNKLNSLIQSSIRT